jgi:GTP-binding protein
MAVADADAVVLLLDGKTGISPHDRDMVDMLRDLKKPVLYAVNKIDGPIQESALTDFFALGIDEPYPVSAEHGYGMSDFLDALIGALPESESDENPEEHIIRVAVVGRPNVGKSSLLNRILGRERYVVSDVPGTTRDASDTLCTINNKTYRLVDTAGIRRKAKVTGRIEKFSVIKALKTLDRCDVAIIVMDASEGVTEQDISVAGYAYERGCGCVLLLNKWDKIEKDKNTVKKYLEEVEDKAKFLNFAPVLTVSALTGQRVIKAFDMVETVYEQYCRRITTGELNRIIGQATAQNEPPYHQGRRLKFYYATQVSTRPPTFVAFVSHPDGVHFSYQRYLINQLREATGLTHTPVRLLLRQRTGFINFGARHPRKKKGR